MASACAGPLATAKGSTTIEAVPERSRDVTADIVDDSEVVAL
jgi:hypothetical protein